MKVSIAPTLKEGLVVGMRSMPGNPYDGHTLAETLEQVGILAGTDRPPATAIVDKGYRGVQIEGVRILRSGQRCGLIRTLKAMINRRSAIESAIGHMKMDRRLGRNPLKGQIGDAIHALMCGAGHNLRLILAALRLCCARLGQTMQALIAVLIAPALNLRPAPTAENRIVQGGLSMGGLRLPSKRQSIRHQRAPPGRMGRYSPFPSASREALFAGFAARLPVSVSTMAVTPSGSK